MLICEIARNANALVADGRYRWLTGPGPGIFDRGGVGGGPNLDSENTTETFFSRDDHLIEAGWTKLRPEASGYRQKHFIVENGWNLD